MGEDVRLGEDGPMARVVRQIEFVDGLRDLLITYPGVDAEALEEWNSTAFQYQRPPERATKRIVLVSEEPLRLAMMHESLGGPVESDTAESAAELVVALESAPAGLVVIDDETPRDEFRLARGVARAFGVPVMGWEAAMHVRAMLQTGTPSPEDTRFRHTSSENFGN